MKKLKLFTILFIINSNLIFAQSWDLIGNNGTSTSNFIGTIDNQQLKLKTNGVTRLTIGTNSGAVNQGAVTIGDLNPDIAPDYGGMLRIKSPNNTTAIDLIRSSNSDPNGWDNQIRFYNYNGLRHVIADDYSTGKLVISHTANDNSVPVSDILDIRGRVQIGGDINSYPAPANYKLYVESGILTEKVKVAIKTTGDWSDYVFDRNYILKPLTEVEKFIKANKHLPNVPSAEQMVKEGNDLGKTDALLLQKIEELTLYLIELKKENEKIKIELISLKRELIK